MIELLQGDCLEKLKLLDDNSIDALVTDPPAGIGFMGKEWDKDKGGRDGWIAWLTEIMVEAMRTMKPGAHGLVWALPRTSHWTAMALEDAGFEVRDCVYHVFGSGFPKSLNVGKAIDKLEGNEREVVGTQMLGGNAAQTTKEKGGTYASNTDAIGVKPIEVQLTKGSTVWEGWGTALKPAVECWWLVRKPLAESTVAKNVLAYGTGGLNIDGSRIESDGGHKRPFQPTNDDRGIYGEQSSFMPTNAEGRWPSHLIHDGSDVIVEQFPQTTSGSRKAGQPRNAKSKTSYVMPDTTTYTGNGSSGSASRFFYCAKPSKAERNAKLDGFKEKPSGGLKGTEDQTLLTGSGNIRDNMNTNHHPTVKGQALMRYLITLITPPDGTVLDMFMGSGSTGVAAKALGFGFVGVELEQEYFEIAKARIDGTKFGEPLEFDKPVFVDENQLDLFGGV